MGNLFGEEQSGEATFRVADPVRDEELNIEARVAAERLLERDPDLTTKENAGIRKVLSARYSRALDLFLKVGDVVEVSSPAIGTLRNRIVAS